MSELTRLLEQVASHLGGHPVKVRWRAPARKDARAMAFKHNGRAIIDFRPGRIWDNDTLLHDLCHEAGHVRDLFDEWTDLPDFPSDSIRPSKQALKLSGVVEVEDSAEGQARRWLDYAEKNYMRYVQTGDNQFTASLRALADWR